MGIEAFELSQNKLLHQLFTLQIFSLGNLTFLIEKDSTHFICLAICDVFIDRNTYHYLFKILNNNELKNIVSKFKYNEPLLNY